MKSSEEMWGTGRASTPRKGPEPSGGGAPFPTRPRFDYTTGPYASNQSSESASVD